MIVRDLLQPPPKQLGVEWGKNSILRQPPRTHYKIIVISDTHTPRDDGHPKYLREFLSYNSADIYIGLGDTHEGYDDTLQPLGEVHLRVRDLLHARRAEGAQLIDIPGNHDAYKRRDDVLGHQIFGSDYWRDLTLYDGHEKVLLLHGDDLEGDLFRSSDRLLYKAFKSIRFRDQSLVEMWGALEQMGHKMFTKRHAKKIKGRFAEKAGEMAIARGCTKVLCGHKHDPRPFTPVGDEGGVLYGNSGSWVNQQCTAMALTADNHWVLIDWRKERARYFDDKPPGLDTDNDHVRFRDISLEEHRWQQATHAVFVNEGFVRQAAEKLEQLDKARRRLKQFFDTASEKLAQAQEERETVARHAAIGPAKPLEMGVPALQKFQ